TGDAVHRRDAECRAVEGHRSAVSPPGFEPGTKGLKVPCSTVELRALGVPLRELARACGRRRARERSDTGPNGIFSSLGPSDQGVGKASSDECSSPHADAAAGRPMKYPWPVVTPSEISIASS